MGETEIIEILNYFSICATIGAVGTLAFYVGYGMGAESEGRRRHCLLRRNNSSSFLTTGVVAAVVVKEKDELLLLDDELGCTRDIHPPHYK